VVGGEENGEDDGFFYFFLGSTQVLFIYFYIILISFNLMWHPKTWVPRHVAPRNHRYHAMCKGDMALR
jgi:hypothetical protein